METVAQIPLSVQFYTAAAVLALAAAWDALTPANDEPVAGYTAADALWAAETCPLDGGWVEGESAPFDLELLTVSALEFFNDRLDPELNQAAAESEAQARIELGILF